MMTGTFRRIFACLLASLAALLCASCGPRMREQPSIQPYERRMPPMPVGTVPTRGRPDALLLQQSKLVKNPLPSTPKNIRAGCIYYNHYCMMCHGEDGRGNGPVGISYVPKPTDLTSQRVRSLNDGQIYYRMLTGVGHAPVMDQTVLPGQRWPIVLYVRSLNVVK